MPDPLLFADADLRLKCAQAVAQMVQGINNYEANKLLNANVDDLVDYFARSAAIEPVQLIEEDITVSASETSVDVSQRFNYAVLDRSTPTWVPGTRVRCYVPFTGDRELFSQVASRRTFNPPRAIVGDGELVITFEGTSGDMSRVKQSIQTELQSIKKHMEYTNQDVEAHNSGLERTARKAIQERRARLLGQRDLEASLGFPIRTRPDRSDTYSLPAKRKSLVPSKPPPGSSKAFKPEPTLDSRTYDEILRVLPNMARVMEEHPDAFSRMKEEHLRSHFLVQLNGQFEVATGETFRGSGSTDILLGIEGKEAFVAECKFWSGPKSLSSALDQLSDYTLWRDAKAAILLFNRNKNFSAVLEKIPAVLAAHEQIVGEVETLDETTFRLRVRQRDDPDRVVTVTVLLFDVPLARGRSDRLVPREDEVQT